MSTSSETQTPREAALAELIVKTLDLEVSAAAIAPDAPLYGEGPAGGGLGLDSIDMLEIALTVSQHFGVQLRADNKDNNQAFSSLRSLDAFIRRHQAGRDQAGPDQAGADQAGVHEAG